MIATLYNIFGISVYFVYFIYNYREESKRSVVITIFFLSCESELGDSNSSHIRLLPEKVVTADCCVSCCCTWERLRLVGGALHGPLEWLWTNHCSPLVKWGENRLFWAQDRREAENTSERLSVLQTGALLTLPLHFSCGHWKWESSCQWPHR